MKAPDQRSQVGVEPVVGNIDQLRVVVQYRLHLVVYGLHRVATNDGGPTAALALRKLTGVALGEQEADGEGDHNVPRAVDVLVIVLRLHKGKQGQAHCSEQGARE